MSSDDLPHFPACGEDVETPQAEVLKLESFFDDDMEVDVSVSASQHIQISCPHCEHVLGYVGTAAAAGGPQFGGMYGD